MNHKPSNIALTGPPASGKSAVGMLLASELGKTFVDTDDELEKQFGCSITEYFDQHGEASFRQAETFLLADICRGSDLIIATGGGILLDPKNRDLLESTCRLINLRASIGDLLSRQRGSNRRPLLKGEKETKLRELMKARKPIYDSVEIQVDTGGKTVEQAVREIIGLINLKQV